VRWRGFFALAFFLGAIGGVGLFAVSTSDEGFWNRLGVHPYVALYAIMAFVFLCLVGLGVLIIARVLERWTSTRTGMR